MQNILSLNCPGCNSYFYQNEYVASSSINTQVLSYRCDQLADHQSKYHLMRCIVSLLNAGGGSIYMPVQQGTGKIAWGQRLSNPEQNQFRRLVETSASQIQPIPQIVVVFVPVLTIPRRVFHGSFVTKIIVVAGQPTCHYKTNFRGFLQCFVRDKSGFITHQLSQKANKSPQQPKFQHQCQYALPQFEVEMPAIILKGSKTMLKQTGDRLSALSKVHDQKQQVRIRCDGYREFYIVLDIINHDYTKVIDLQIKIKKDSQDSLKIIYQQFKRLQTVKPQEQSMRRSKYKIPLALKQIPSNFNFILNIYIDQGAVNHFLNYVLDEIDLEELRYKCYEGCLIMFFTKKTLGIALKQFINKHKLKLQAKLKVKKLQFGEFFNNIQIRFITGICKQKLHHYLIQEFRDIKVKHVKGDLMEVNGQKIEDTLRILEWLIKNHKDIQKKVRNPVQLEFNPYYFK